MISGVKATNCASVVFMSCSVSGIMHFGYPASHGVESVNSHILAYDSTFTGGDGYDAPFVDFGCVNGQPGGDGVSMTFGTLFASRCSFKGGSGGDELYSLVCQPGPGGNGLDLNSMALIELQNCSYVAGPAGAGSPPQPPSPPLKSDSPVVQFTGPKRLYQISSPVREQQVIQLEFQLDVPSEVYLLASPDPGVDVFFGGLTGPLALDAFAMGFVSLGMLPAGTTVLSVPAGNLPPTLPGSFLSTQPLFTDSSWSYFELGSPSHLVLLDGSL
jgi:hypothetical protein